MACIGISSIRAKRLYGYSVHANIGQTSNGDNANVPPAQIDFQHVQLFQLNQAVPLLYGVREYLLFVPFCFLCGCLFICSVYFFSILCFTVKAMSSTYLKYCA